MLIFSNKAQMYPFSRRLHMDHFFTVFILIFRWILRTAVLALHLAIRNTFYRSSTLYLFNKILPAQCFSNSTLHPQYLLWVSMLAFRRILQTQRVPILSCSQYTIMWFHSLVLPANAHTHNVFRQHHMHILPHILVFQCLSFNKISLLQQVFTLLHQQYTP